MMITLITVAVLSYTAINVHSEGLGVKALTVIPGEVPKHAPLMFRVVEVEPGKLGAATGLQSGDMILGVCIYDVTKPEDVSYPPITPETFRRFPSTFVSGNTVQSILVYRPSLDSTAELHVNFSKNPPRPWPSGTLGVIAVNVTLRNNPRVIPIESSRVEILQVHPYSLADRSGLLVGDVITGAMISGRDDDRGLEFMPMVIKIVKVDDLKKAIGVVRKYPRAEMMRLSIQRGDKKIYIDIPTIKLR